MSTVAVAAGGQTVSLPYTVNTPVAPALVTGLATDSVALFTSVGGGKVKSRRDYQGVPATPPASFANSCAQNDPGLGVTLPIASFKSDPVATARGDYDTQIAGLARTSPDGTCWAWWHEPEGSSDMPGSTDGARADAFAAAASHVATVMKAANPKVQVGVIFTISLWWAASGHDENRWLSVGGKPLPIDWIGLDGYNSCGINGRPWNEADAIFGPMIDWLAANRPGWTVRVTETGCVADSRRPAWITRTWAYLASRGVGSAVYWSSGTYALDSAGQSALLTTVS